MGLGRKSRKIAFARTLASRMGLIADIRLTCTFSAPVLQGHGCAAFARNVTLPLWIEPVCPYPLLMNSFLPQGGS